MPVARQYELVYIVAPTASEETVADLHTQIEQIVSRFDGRLEKTENWGRRKLAYEIDRFTEGTYVLELLSGSGEMVAEIGRRLRVTDDALRYLIVRVDEELRVAERTTTRRKNERARRRRARGLPPEPVAAEQPTSRPGSEGAGGGAAPQPGEGGSNA